MLSFFPASESPIAKPCFFFGLDIFFLEMVCVAFAKKNISRGIEENEV